ncbi:MAG: YigZ family protein [Crocinitomicaceae bacterium]|nr:YigZ family protein [Crocinitomicaceae bacterium]|tara:strand:- start:6761 stop:7375 length:615 start_codon:yes stop_codon:yes gene_type:complete
MSDTDSYLSLKGRSEGLFKSKGSKHFGYAFPVKSESEIKGFIESLKEEHHSARHFCYAYRLGHDGAKYRANDDGEPSNSAGAPILGILKSHNLTNSLIVVVRYFGGTKLGVGGLIEAYREAAQAAVTNGQIIERHREKTLKVTYPYSRMGEIMSILKKENLSSENKDFQQECNLEIKVRLSIAEEIFNQLNEIDGAKVEVIVEY